MKNRATNILTALIITALCGLIALQIFFLRNAYQQEKQIFHNNVIAALNSLSRSLEEQEAASGIVDVVYDVRSLPPMDSTEKKLNRVFYQTEKKRPVKTGIIKVNKNKNNRWDTVISSQSIIVKDDTAHNTRIFISAAPQSSKESEVHGEG